MALLGDIVVKLGLDMKDFQKGISKAEKSLKDTGEKFKGVGESLATSITLPLMAIGGISIASASEVQKSQGLVQAQLGLTGEEAKGLQDIITDLYNDGFGGDMQEVTNAVTNIKRNMKEMSDATDEELANVAKSTMNLATVFGQDVNDITKSVNGMQQAFGDISIEHAFDMITTGFQNGLDYSGEFLDTINEYSVHFAEMGFTSEQMFGVFQEGAETGAFQLDKVGDLVKELNIRLSDGTADEYIGNFSKGTQQLYTDFKKTGEGGAELFQNIMKELAECDSETEAYQLGVALMGTQFEDLDFTAVQALANVKDGFTDVEGATNDLNDAMHKDIGTTLTSAFREIQTALVPVGEALSELITRYLPPVIDFISRLAEKFANLSPKSQLVVVAFGVFGAILPPLIIIIGSVISAVGSIIGVFGRLMPLFTKVGGAITKVWGLFKKLRTVMSFAKILPLITGPVGIIIGVIAGLIAIGVAIWKNWETISEKASEIWSSVKETVGGFISGMVESIKEKISAISEWFSGAWETVKTATVTAFTAIKDFLVNFFLTLFSWTPIGMFVNFIIENWETIKETTRIIFDMIKTTIQIIFNAILSVVSPIVTNIWNFIKSAWNKIKEVTSTVFNAIKSVLVSIWNSIVSVVMPIVTGIWNKITSIWNKIKSVTSSVFNSVRTTISDIWNKIKTKIVDTATSIWSSAKEKFEKVKNAVVEPIEKARDLIESAIEKIKGFFSNLKLTIPKPKIPKVTVTEAKGVLGIPYPKFSVDWNAKGNIFNGASILGGGQGVGEAGAEVVMPIQRKRYMKPYASMVADLMSDNNDMKGTSIVNQFNISELVVREEADIKRIAEELQKVQKKETRARGTLSFA